MSYRQDDGYVQHSGILGMRWGRRRYQNKDGSLTQEGRVHYGVGKARKKNGGKAKKDRLAYKKWGDEELRTKTRRLRDENDYVDAYRKNKDYATPTWKKEMKSILREVGRDITKELIKNATRDAINSLAGKEVIGNGGGNKDKEKKK